MYISFLYYLEKFHDLTYKDYLILSDDERKFYFIEYKRYVYDGEIKLTIYHRGR